MILVNCPVQVETWSNCQYPVRWNMYMFVQFFDQLHFSSIQVSRWSLWSMNAWIGSVTKCLPVDVYWIYNEFDVLVVVFIFLKEITKFATYVIRQFVEVAEKNKKVFMEMLFWKGHREASEIVDGYGSYQGYSCNLAFSTVFLKAKEIFFFLKHNRRIL